MSRTTRPCPFGCVDMPPAHPTDVPGLHHPTFWGFAGPNGCYLLRGSYYLTNCLHGMVLYFCPWRACAFYAMKYVLCAAHPSSGGNEMMVVY